MKAYGYTYRAVAIIYMLPLLWLLFVGSVAGNIIQIFGYLAAGVLLWVGERKACSRRVQGVAVSSLVLAVLCVPLVYRLVRRAEFVSENGGMERADSYGSPLAFLVGLIFESALLAPLVCTLLFGLFLLIRYRGKHV